MCFENDSFQRTELLLLQHDVDLHGCPPAVGGLEGTCRVPPGPVLTCRLLQQTGGREDHACLLPASRCAAGICRGVCSEVALKLTFCLHGFVLQVNILTDKLLFPLLSSMSNCLSVLGGAGKVSGGSARLRHTSWEGDRPRLCASVTAFVT